MDIAKFVLNCVEEVVAKSGHWRPQGMEYQQLDVSGNHKWYLNNRFFPGCYLQVQGSVYRNANRFNLDFGCEKGRTIALHFNPRFPEQIVVRNSMTRRDWDEEERSGKFPFSQGREFTMQFISQRDCIMVLVNGEMYTHFKHRHQPEDITYLEIDGDACITKAYYVSKRAPPAQTIHRSLVKQNIQYKNVELRNNKCCLEDGFLPGTRIRISGSVFKNADRFAVNLICNGETGPIALHFNPRFPEQVVVRNSQTRGNWDDEERDGGFPFSRGNIFTIEILCQEDCYLILVDKKLFTSFDHRHKPENITLLELNGDASLDDVCIYSKKGIQQALESSQSSISDSASAPPPSVYPSCPSNISPYPSVQPVYSYSQFPVYPNPQPQVYPPSQLSYYPPVQPNQQACYPTTNPPQQTPYPTANTPQFNSPLQQTPYSTNPPQFTPPLQQTLYPATNPPQLNLPPHQAPYPATNPPQLNLPPHQGPYLATNPPQFSSQPQPTLNPTINHPQVTSSLQQSTVGSTIQGQIPKPFNQGIPTVRPIYPFDPECDANVLRKALKGIGTDEKTIIQMLTKRTNAQRMEIARQYKSLNGKDLSFKLKDELSGSLSTLIVALMTPLAEFKAKEIHDAISFNSVDKDTLLELLCTATSPEILDMRNAYQRMYHSNLENDLKTTTSGTFRSLLITLCQSQRSNEDNTVDYHAAVGDAQALSNAGYVQPTCVESIFLSILCSRSFPQLAQVLTEYQRLTGKDLEKTIREEFSGDTEAGLLAIVKSAKNKAGFFAEQLRSTFKGANTKDGNLIRIVVTRSEIDMKTIKEAFVDKYEKSLEQCIKDQTSGDFKRCLLSLID